MLNINFSDWEKIWKSIWKKVIYDSCKTLRSTENRTLHLETNISEAGFELSPGHFQSEKVCHICSMIFLSKSSLACHMRSHDSEPSKAYFIQVFPRQLTDKSWQFCDKDVRLQQVWEARWDCTGFMPTPETIFLAISGRASKMEFVWWATCNPPDTFKSAIVRHIYNRVCLSWTGLASIWNLMREKKKKKKHRRMFLSWSFCSKLLQLFAVTNCESIAGLRSHIRVHRNYINDSATPPKK